MAALGLSGGAASPISIYGGKAVASTKIYVCLWPELPGRVRWPDQLARRVGPYIQCVSGPVGAAKGPSQYGYTQSNSGPNKDVQCTSILAHIPTG